MGFTIKAVLHRLKESEFVANVSVLVRGSAIAYVFQLITYLLLPYFFEPRHFGLLGSFVSISSIAFAVSTGRYERAILLPTSRANSDSLIRLTFFLSLAVNTLVFIILFSGSEFFAGLMKYNGTEKYLLYLVAPYSFILSNIEIATYWLNRNTRFTKIAQIKIVYAVSYLLCAIPTGLVNAEIISRLLSIGAHLKKLGTIILNSDSNAENIKIQALKYIDFPKRTAPAAFIGTVSNNVSIIMIAGLYSVSLLGQFVLAYKILSVPVAILGKAISHVYYTRAIAARNNGNLYALFKKVTIVLTGVAVVLMTTILLLSKPAINNFYGEEWESTFSFMGLLLPLFVANFIFTCQSTIIYVMKIQQYELLMNSAAIAVQITLFILAKYFDVEFTRILFIMSISLATLNVITLLAILRNLRRMLT